ERDRRDGAFLGGLDLEELRGLETESPSDEVRGEALARGVVRHDGVVERLACERDAVLRRDELFLKVQHVLVRLEIRIVLDEREQAAERADDGAFGLAEGADRVRVRRIPSGFLELGRGGVRSEARRVGQGGRW